MVKQMNLVTAADVLSFVKIRQHSLCAVCMIDMWSYDSATYISHTSSTHAHRQWVRIIQVSLTTTTVESYRYCLLYASTK